MNPFTGNAHFNWYRKVGAIGAVSVLVRATKFRRVHAVTIYPASVPGELYGQFVTRPAVAA
ncbi:MAG TPA: hypothetical protein VNH18_10565 [Bryobacteraceae bacterium]|nr:hypothetical protein [Bryobacteraceae bacterium]